MSRTLSFFFDRRAITPVLSNLLLTVVAVAAMAIATTATYVITTNLKENMSERIVVEDLWFNSHSPEVDIYLRNIGKVAVRISAVYVNRTSQPFSPTSLELGKHGWLNVSCGWVSGNLYYLDVVTARGTHIGGYYSAP